MAPAVFRYRFARSTPIDEVEQTLAVCVIAVRSLHGGDAATGHHLDRRRRACVVDGRTPAGRDLATLLEGFLVREHGPGAFTVEAGDGGRPPEERRTLGAWAAELDLDADVLADLLAADPDVTLATPLTAAELDDLSAIGGGR